MVALPRISLPKIFSSSDDIAKNLANVSKKTKIVTAQVKKVNVKVTDTKYLKRNLDELSKLDDSIKQVQPNSSLIGDIATKRADIIKNIGKQIDDLDVTVKNLKNSSSKLDELDNIAQSTGDDTLKNSIKQKRADLIKNQLDDITPSKITSADDFKRISSQLDDLDSIARKTGDETLLKNVQDKLDSVRTELKNTKGKQLDDLSIEYKKLQQLDLSDPVKIKDAQKQLKSIEKKLKTLNREIKKYPDDLFKENIDQLKNARTSLDDHFKNYYKKNIPEQGLNTQSQNQVKQAAAAESPPVQNATDDLTKGNNPIASQELASQVNNGIKEAVKANPKNVSNLKRGLIAIGATGVVASLITAMSIMASAKSEQLTTTSYSIKSITKENNLVKIQYEPQDLFIENKSVTINYSNSYPKIDGSYKIIDPDNGVFYIQATISSTGNAGEFKYITDFVTEIENLNKQVTDPYLDTPLFDEFEQLDQEEQITQPEQTTQPDYTIYIIIAVVVVLFLFLMSSSSLFVMKKKPNTITPSS